MIAKTPQPPYYAVIFTNILRTENPEYNEMVLRMEELAKKQPGYLGFESARKDLGISVSYWQDLESIKKWKQHSAHLFAQEKGRENWYDSYKVRIAKIERDYDFSI